MGGDKQTNEWTEEQTKVPVFYRTLSPSGLLPKKLKKCYWCLKDQNYPKSGHIRSFWPDFCQHWLIVNPYIVYVPYLPLRYIPLRKKISYMFPKPQIQYLCSNILETGHIRSFWPYLGQVRLVMYQVSTLQLTLAEESWAICSQSLKFGTCA